MRKNTGCADEKQISKYKIVAINTFYLEEKKL
jgi:hypothetical protein